MRNSSLHMSSSTTLTLLAAILAMALLFTALSNSGTANAQTPCSNGIAVPNPSSNPGLVSDCQVLLAARDTLAGTASLNWSADVNIETWDGISVGGLPSRVIVLELKAEFDKEGPALNGQIPPELSNLSNLEEIDLGSRNSICIDGECREVEEREFNRLTGPIPSELGNLTNLERLYLFGNQLTGPIPPELGNLTNLERLYLNINQLTGPIPPELGNLTNLERLYLNRNRLTGPIPSELGNLTNLERLSLYTNQLTGPIPSELGSLTNLERLYLQDNEFTGSLPLSFINLTALESLAFGNNAGLCAPIDTAFQAWMRGIANDNLPDGVTGLGPNCGSVVPQPTPTPEITATSIPTPEPTATPTTEPTALPTETPVPTATPTSVPGQPTATPVPSATPSPEPTATATPIAPAVPEEVLNRLSALETLVATLQSLISTLESSISALNSSVSALANRVATLEADASIPTPVPTPTTVPGETPVPTPTTVPGETPVPTPTQTPVADSCLTSIPSDGAANGRWNNACTTDRNLITTNAPIGTRYAGYYTFVLSQQSEVTITLESSEDTYLFLLEGTGRNGSVIEQNDDIDTDAQNYNSRIVETLAAGEYTIVATTYNLAKAGDFTLTVSGIR